MKYRMEIILSFLKLGSGVILILTHWMDAPTHLMVVESTHFSHSVISLSYRHVPNQSILTQRPLSSQLVPWQDLGMVLELRSA